MSTKLNTSPSDFANHLLQMSDVILLFTWARETATNAKEAGAARSNPAVPTSGSWYSATR